MIILKPYQHAAVEQLTELFFQLVSSEGRQQKLVFKAPTGAGKTVTMAALLNRICAEAPMRRELRTNTRGYAFVWIAPNQLHLQSFAALKNYFAELRSIRPIQFEDITDGQLWPHEVLFLNWQSVSQENNRYVRDNERGNNLGNYVTATRASGVELIAVLDEAHLFASKGEKAQALLRMLNAKIEIDVSATPLFRSDYQHIIPRSEVVGAEMIKRGVLLNPSISAASQGTQSVNEYLLQAALDKREELRQAYERLGVRINPLLLIQLPSDSQKETALDREIKDKILVWFENHPRTPMSVLNGRLAVWLSGEKQNLDRIERFDSPVDVLLFKQAIALGWDCPRAAVLLIFRELKQETFTIQTVGRILRMPEQRHYADSMLNYGYVFTNLSRNQIQVVADEMDYLVQNTARRIDTYRSLALPSVYTNTQMIRNRLSSRFRKDCFYRAGVEYFGLRDPNESYADAQAATVFNGQQLKAKFVELDVTQIEIPLPRDLRLSGETEAVSVESKERFARTYSELNQMFADFCWSHMGGYSKTDSFEVLKAAIIRFMEHYLGINEFQTAKIVLHSPNQAFFIEIIEKAMHYHDELLREKAARASRETVEYEWDVPPERIYNDRYAARPSERHALQPFYEQKDASKPERAFVSFLESQPQWIRWWYKNGEKNKEDFAVSYQDARGLTRSFYVDFVICLANNIVCLFDTKTLHSDIEFCAKHNALFAYIQHLNQTRNTAYVGGVIVPENDVWRYPNRLIATAESTAGWAVFNPAALAQQEFQS